VTYSTIISGATADSSVSTFRRRSLDFWGYDDILHGAQGGNMKKQRAFSLIELMIAIAIIAVLGMIAYPSYQSYLRKGHRAAAQTFMLDIASRQQQYLLDTRTYASDIPGVLKLAPSADLAGRYTFAVVPAAGPPPSFVITATPVTGSSQDGDGALTLDNLGNKTPANKW
jgi:type IV pilus assembly protein PilE